MNDQPKPTGEPIPCKAGQGFIHWKQRHADKCLICHPQPKPAGEWTAGRADGTGKFGIYHGNETKKGWSGKGRLLVEGLLESQSNAIADAHNAALAKARLEAHNYWSQAVDSAQHQLAAEREKVTLATQMQTLVDALTEALSDIETSNDQLSTCSKIRTALAKVAK